MQTMDDRNHEQTPDQSGGVTAGSSPQFPASTPTFQDPTHERAHLVLTALCGKSNDERYQTCANVLASLSPHVWEQHYPGGKNLVCTFSDNPQYKRIIGAHFDLVPNSPGANDNGAAVAELVAVAAEFYAHKFHSDDLAFVLFDNEEIMNKSPDLSGSKQFADFLNTNSYTPDEVIVLDVCGSGDVVVLSSTAPSSDVMKQNIRDALDCTYTPTVEMWTPESDSSMFGHAGIEAVLLSTLSSRSLRLLEPVHHSGTWDKTNAFPGEWLRLHSARDNMNSIDPETLGMMVDVIRRLATR